MFEFPFFCVLLMSLGDPLKEAKGAQMVHNWPKIAVLVIETYFLASRLSVTK